MRPIETKTTTLRDALAKRLFCDLMMAAGMLHTRDVGDAFASREFDDFKRRAYSTADDMLDTAERWVSHTSDGKLSTARTLKLPTT